MEIQTPIRAMGEQRIVKGRVPRIAIVSCLPDFGHVAPLLRIGAACRDAGHEVRSFLPEECEPLARSLGVPFVSLGSFASEARARAEREFQYSRFRSNLDLGSLLRYWEALRWSGSAAILPLRQGLAELNPDVLLADPHVFRTWYHRLATGLGAELVLHASEGTVRRWQRHWRQLFVFYKGPSSVPRPLLWPLGAAYGFGDWLFSALRGLELRVSPQRRRRHRETESRLQAALGTGTRRGGRGRIPRTISTGLGLVEIERLRALLTIPRGVTFFGPVFPKATVEIPTSLRSWLESVGDRRVVYVSFGTMIHVGESMVRMITAAADELGLAVLWTVGAASAARLSPVGRPDFVRIEARVPQQAVLALPQVVACVCHAGAGTIQEALIAGKPLLCVPMKWDQYYNAEIARRLGVAVRLRRGTMRRRSLVAALRRLLEDPSYRAAAEELRDVFRQQDGGGAVARYIEGVTLDSRILRAASPLFTARRAGARAPGHVSPRTS